MSSRNINRRVLLNSRPHGSPKAENFRIEEAPIPEINGNQLLLKNQFLSLDPYMRGRMSDGPSYVSPIEVGGVMEGGTVSRVERTGNKDFQVGDLIVGFGGWQDYWVSNGEGLVKLSSKVTMPSMAIGVLGMPGFTAYMGLLDIGQPKAGETVVVAAASGAVGAVVGQIAKLKGCRVVGIAGGANKCQFVVDNLGFDECLDRHQRDFEFRLKSACSKGIDVYFESVGGAVFDAVLPLLNVKARIPLCGLISHYNDTELPPGPDRLSLLTRTILTKRLKIQGFIISADYGHRFEEFFEQMSEWVATGKIVHREDIVEGLENAPSSFIGLLQGENFGKLVIQL